MATINNINVERKTSESTNWQKTITMKEINDYWNYFVKDNQIVLTKYKGNDKNVEIPRTIEGKTVTLRGLSKDMFPGVTHIKVAEHKNGEGKVKINTKL